MSSALDALKNRVKDLEDLYDLQDAALQALTLRTTAVEASYAVQAAAIQALTLRTTTVEASYAVQAAAIQVLKTIPPLRKYLPVDPILNVELLSGSESPLVRAYNELPIEQVGINNFLKYANLPAFLKELAVTTSINDGDLVFNVKQTTTAYLMMSTFWEGVDLTGWTELQRGYYIGPVKKECIIYTKTLVTGQYTFSNSTALYFFAD